MNIEGTWFMQPGDLPSAFAWRIEINPDGTALWDGKPARWQLVGDKLDLFEGDDQRPQAWFAVPDDTAETLMGNLVVFWDPPYEHEGQTFEPEPATDSAALLRDPGELEVVG